MVVEIPSVHRRVSSRRSAKRIKIRGRRSRNGQPASRGISIHTDSGELAVSDIIGNIRAESKRTDIEMLSHGVCVELQARIAEPGFSQ